MINYEHKVQYYETDQMGVVHHSNYIRWFEEARSDFMEQYGLGYDKMEAYGIICPVVGVEATYKTMTRYGETVVIESKVKAYNSVRLEIEYIIMDKETREIRCKGVSKHCFLDANNKLARLSKVAPEFDEMFANANDFS